MVPIRDCPRIAEIKWSHAQISFAKTYEKVHQYFVKTVISSFGQCIYATKPMYQTIKVILLSTGTLALVRSILLIYIKIEVSSFFLFSLSCALFLGAYMTHHAMIQKSLADASQLLHIQIQDLKKVIKEFESKFDKIDNTIQACERIHKELIAEKKSFALELNATLVSFQKFVKEVTDPQIILVKIEELKLINQSIKDATAELICVKEDLSKMNTEIMHQAQTIKKQNKILEQLHQKMEKEIASFAKENKTHSNLNDEIFRFMEKFKNT